MNFVGQRHLNFFKHEGKGGMMEKKIKHSVSLFQHHSEPLPVGVLNPHNYFLSTLLVSNYLSLHSGSS